MINFHQKLGAHVIAIILAVAVAAGPQNSVPLVLDRSVAPPVDRSATPPIDSQAAMDAMPRYYPVAAQRALVRGTATVNCLATADRKITDCNIASEAPGGWGFGAAALELSALMKVKPTAPLGPIAQGARLDIPIAFVIDGDVLSPFDVIYWCYDAFAREGCSGGSRP